jgi:hypothetical protein
VDAAAGRGGGEEENGSRRNWPPGEWRDPHGHQENGCVSREGVAPSDFSPGTALKPFISLRTLTTFKDFP